MLIEQDKDEIIRYNDPDASDYDSIDDVVDEEVFGKVRFNISSHGTFLDSKHINYIRIPKINGFDVFVYFASLNGQLCSSVADCFCSNTESYYDFKVAEDTEDSEYMGRVFTNKYKSGDIIRDYYLLNDDEELEREEGAFIDFCNDNSRSILTKIKKTDTYYLSEVLIKIKKFIELNNIVGPFHIYCIFCLVNSILTKSQYDEYMTKFVSYTPEEQQIFVSANSQLSPPRVD